MSILSQSHYIMKGICNSKGSATILMVMIAGVIITVGMGFNWLVKEHLQNSEGLRNKTEAILKARSAYDSVIYQILNGRMSQKEVLFIGGQEFSKLDKLPLNNRKVMIDDDVYIRAQDSNGELSLTTVQEGALKRMIQKVGNLENASGPVESFLDWIIPGEFSRPNGAKSFYYQSQGLPYKPRNYALQYKEELTMIKGIDRKLYAKIEPCLTMLPATGFNPNTASDDVLMSYLDISDETLKKLRDYMAAKPLSSDAELFALTGRRLVLDEGIFFFPSTYMDITISVGQPRSFYTIRAGLNIRQTATAPYSTMYWIEE
jgi:general secretion pathway protein K